VSKIYSYITVQ